MIDVKRRSCPVAIREPLFFPGFPDRSLTSLVNRWQTEIFYADFSNWLCSRGAMFCDRSFSR
jgi:hypothetical protein